MQPMSVDHPKKKTCSCAETKAARGASWKIRNYTVHDAAPLGSGGLGEVFRAVHQGGRIVALKVGNSMAWKDFTWSTSRNEWNVYVALGLGRGITWLPDVYQYGLRSTGQGMAPWLSMELLGPSFYDLSEAAQPDPMPELRNFACSAVNALRALHCRGFLHRDVKPENIMTRVPRVFNKIPDVVLVDFGMAVQWLPGATRPKPRFAGTPDYASAAAMREEELGPCDDLESLGYTLLFMWSGRLPWPSLPDELPQRSGGGSGWTRTELASMAASREQHWEKSVASEQIPRWLDDWITHCQSLSPLEVPDYEALTKLIPSKQVLPVEKESVLGVKMAEIEACWPEE